MDNSGLSRINQLKEVRLNWCMASRILINDVTLREGDQTLAVPFTIEDKILIARKLDALGVHQIQAGWPARKPEDRDIMHRLRDAGVRARLEAVVPIYGKNWQEEVAATIASAPDVVDLMHPASDIRIQVLKTTRTDALGRVRDSLNYAKGAGICLRLALIDATRADLAFLKDMAAQAVEAGAERIGVADTAGAILPAGMAYLVREIAQVARVPIQVHAHNDFGLALANTLAALEAGASIADVSINGLGERAGNVSLDELVVVLQTLYSQPLGIRTEGLYDLSQVVARIANVPIPPMKPLMGEDAFVHKLAMHRTFAQIDPRSYETIDPKTIGRPQHSSFPPGGMA